MSARFQNRAEAGRMLAEQLMDYRDRPDVLVLGLPRGGIPVAFEIARALAAPLDVFVVRKLGVPGHEELAMGALAAGGIRVLNEDVLDALAIPPTIIERVARHQQLELQRRQELYRGDRPPINAKGRTVILVDDGLATGSTMRAAIAALRAMHPARLIVAVPTGAPDVCQSIEALVDQILCLITPEPFYAVGLWYQDFSQVSDAEVRQLLEKSRRSMHPPHPEVTHHETPHPPRRP